MHWSGALRRRAHAPFRLPSAVKRSISSSRCTSSFATDALHTGSEKELSASGGITPAIELSTAFALPEANMTSSYSYSRFAAPTRVAFERQVAALEGITSDASYTYGTENAGALAFSSGTAAASAAVTALVKNSGHIVTVSDVYGGTVLYFNAIAAITQNVKTDYVDIMHTSPGLDTIQSDQDAAQEIENRLAAVLTPETDALWIETPANPTLRVADINLIVAKARKYAPNIKVVLDNTFASPFWQTPFLFKENVDIVLHSATKYINGHSDVLAGLLVTRNKDLLQKLRLVQKGAGAVLSPFDSWLALRGAKTLHVRAREHGLSALRVALWLQTKGIASGLVRSVEYPGLQREQETPAQARSRKTSWAQLSPHAKDFVKSLTTTSLFGRKGTSSDLRPLFGLDAPDGEFLVDDKGEPGPFGFPASGMLAVRVNSPHPQSQEDSQTAQAFLQRLKVFQLGVSLGGVESLAQLPLTMSHVSVPPDQRVALGIDGELVRLSVGLEDSKDLIQDLDQALRG